MATRDFEGAHSVAQEIHHRITHAPEGPLTPPLTSATDLIPRDAPEDYWGGWRTGRCRDTRRHDLGAEMAEQPLAWALDALGPVPEDVVERQEWEHRANAGAAAWMQSAGCLDARCVRVVAR